MIPHIDAAAALRNKVRATVAAAFGRDHTAPQYDLGTLTARKLGIPTRKRPAVVRVIANRADRRAGSHPGRHSTYYRPRRSPRGCYRPAPDTSQEGTDQ